MQRMTGSGHAFHPALVQKGAADSLQNTAALKPGGSFYHSNALKSRRQMPLILRRNTTEFWSDFRLKSRSCGSPGRPSGQGGRRWINLLARRLSVRIFARWISPASPSCQDPSYCYKFYWLEAIVGLISKGSKGDFWPIIDEMICSAWYSVRNLSISVAFRMTEVSGTG